jgi:activator of HSP90 ATPase
MTFCKDYFESQLNTEQNVSFGEKWFRLVSETFGNKSNVVRKFSISNASVEGECSVSTRKKGKKFGVFDLKVTMQYEVEVECMVKTKKKKKKEEENVDGLDGEEEEEEKEEEETKACAVKGEISLKEFSSLNEAEEYEWTTKTTGGEEEAKAIVKTWFTRPVLEKMFAETLETFVEKMNEFCAE